MSVAEWPHEEVSEIVNSFNINDCNITQNFKLTQKHCLLLEVWAKSGDRALKGGHRLVPFIPHALNSALEACI